MLVTRLGTTHLDRLHELCELLAGNDIIPLGFTLVGTARGDGGYYGEATDPRSPLPAGQAERALSARAAPHQDGRLSRGSGPGRETQAALRKSITRSVSASSVCTDA